MEKRICIRFTPYLEQKIDELTTETGIQQSILIRVLCQKSLNDLLDSDGYFKPERLEKIREVAQAIEEKKDKNRYRKRIRPDP